MGHLDDIFLKNGPKNEFPGQLVPRKNRSVPMSQRIIALPHVDAVTYRRSLLFFGRWINTTLDVTPDQLLSLIQSGQFDQIKAWSACLNWRRVSSLDGLTEPFVREFAPRLCWDTMATTQCLPEALIVEMDRAYPTLIKWNELAATQPFNDAFLEEHLHRFDWYDLSMNPHLSEAFIRRHADELYWTELCTAACQMPHISNQLIVQFQDRIPTLCLPVSRLFCVLGQLRQTKHFRHLEFQIYDYADDLQKKLKLNVMYLEDWLVVWAMTWVGCGGMIQTTRPY